MLLCNVLTDIFSECVIGKETISQYKRAVRRFSNWMNRPATSDDLNRVNLNNFIAYIESRSSGTTAGQYRRSLCRIWNHLTEFENKPAYEIKRLRRPKAEEIVVVAWTPEEFELLLKGANDVVGRTRKTRISGRDLCTAMLWVGYDTGLRPSDIFRLKWSQIDLKNRTISLVQHKTKKSHLTFLDEPALAALKAIFSIDREFIFPVTWSSTRKWMDKVFVNAAKYGFVRVKGRNLGTLRKTNATEIFKAHGQLAAAESLGHVSGPQLVKKHYIDQRASRQYSVPPRPPSFGQRAS